MQDKRVPRTNTTTKAADPVQLRPAARPSKRRRAPYEDEGAPVLKRPLTDNRAMDVAFEPGASMAMLAHVSCPAYFHCCPQARPPAHGCPSAP
jgi:hypothetical protein